MRGGSSRSGTRRHPLNFAGGTSSVLFFLSPPVPALFLFSLLEKSFSPVCIPTFNAANTSYVESPSLEGFTREWNTQNADEEEGNEEEKYDVWFRFFYFIIF